ncbi:MAG: zeta toxin family protein [Patescibacteria group bacterium]
MPKKPIKSVADAYARRNKIKIAKKLTNISIYTASDVPVSVFMAGSPGAGKTEFSKRLIKIIEKDRPKVVRIDGDEIREFLPGYTGKNSKIFQGAISLIVDKMHDLVLHRKQNFILDGTFWRYEKAVQNIERSLKKNRLVYIFYIFQRPDLAWNFTKKRELLEGRNIPKSAFINQFFGAKNTVNKIRLKYGKDVTIFLVEKNYEENSIKKLVDISIGDNIDKHIPNVYTATSLRKSLR